MVLLFYNKLYKLAKQDEKKSYSRPKTTTTKRLIAYEKISLLEIFFSSLELFSDEKNVLRLPSVKVF